MKNILIITLALFTLNGQAQSLISGFSLANNEKVVVVGGSMDLSNTYFTKSSSFEFNRNFTVISAYGAVGLKNEWNILASYALIDFTPQDIKFGFSKPWLHKNAFHLVIGAGLFGPTSDYNAESSKAVGQQAKGIWIDQIVQYRGNGYHVDLSFGINMVDAPTPANIPLSLTIGKSFEHSYLKVFGAYQQSFGNKFYQGIGSEKPSSFKELAVSYTKIGAQWIYTHSSWMPYLGFAQTLSGSNTFKAASYSAGIIKKF
jgi:hypothetical protein